MVNKKKIRIKKRITAFLLAMMTLFNLPVLGYAKEPDTSENIGIEFVTEKTYYEYLAEHENNHEVSEIQIKVEEFIDADKTKIVDDEFGKSVITEEDGFVTYAVDVKESGFYSIFFEYLPLEGKGINIEKEVLINGERPYFEARNLILSRVWQDQSSVRTNTDQNGNEMRPKQVEVFQWMSDSLKDGGAYYSEPMLFYLEEGKQEIKLIALRESIAIRKMTLKPAQKTLSYEEVSKTYEDPTGDALVQFIEAEEPVQKSSPMLIPGFDRASPITSPNSTKEIKLNIISGERWKIPGQWVEYKIHIPKDGLYKIGFRARQNILNGSYSTRVLTIDGRIPFEEAENIRFDYATDWQIVSPQYNGEDCLFYLEEGIHTIRLEATLGTITQYLDIVQGSLARLNEAYRETLMITGPTPDIYRDYEFLKEIPQVFKCFEEEKKVLEEVRQAIEAELGYAGENLTIFTKINLFFDVVLEDPEELAKQMNNFKNYIGALGTWLLTAREQPLDLDGIYIGEAEYEFPKAEAGFFTNLWHELSMFGASFFSDFNSIKGTIENPRGSITVWTSAPRDHVNILRQMIDENFTAHTGIDVNLQLVAGGALLPSTLAGIGPDVALSVSSGDVLNYAARGAILDLNQFSDIEQVKKNFKESALIPMAYNGGFYGIPETQTFPVLFYRKDILAQMGLSVPETWQDVYLMLTEIQKKNMTFGLKTGMASYSMFLSQMDGEFYRDDNRFSNVAADTNVNALRMQTDMFISYQLPQKFDFANRFRTGEMPIGIDDYTTFNLLTVFAPEIKGLWGFAKVPGILQEDGTINHAATSTVNASVIMSGSEQPELAYEFIKWLTSAQTQLQYGRELETILGTAARYNSANVEAVKGSAWHKDEIAVLEEQWDAIKGIPEVPGGYYTTRYMDFAFRAVVLQGELPREVLIEYEDIINEEINYKRLEFGLD